MQNFTRSPFFLLIIITVLAFIASVIYRENTDNQISDSSILTSEQPAKKAVNRFFQYSKEHNEAYIDYLAPMLEKYYLQRNISRVRTLDFSRDWWQKYPYEQFDIDWSQVETTDLGNGNTQFKTNIYYCKGKTSNNLDCRNVFLLIKVNENNQIYYLSNK